MVKEIVPGISWKELEERRQGSPVSYCSAGCPGHLLHDEFTYTDAQLEALVTQEIWATGDAELRRMAQDRGEAQKRAELADARLTTWADWYERHVVYTWAGETRTGGDRPVKTVDAASDDSVASQGGC